MVAAGLTETRCLAITIERLLGRPHFISEAYLRLMLPVAGFSAFPNNTPVVGAVDSVAGPPRGRFSDFVRLGLPVDLLCMVVTVVVTSLVYPF